MDINLLRTHLHNINDMSNNDLISQRRLYEKSKLDETSPKSDDVVLLQESVETDVETDKEDLVVEFFDIYFGGELNENLDFTQSIVDLNITRDAVNAYFTPGIHEELQFGENITMDFISSYFGDDLNEQTSEEDISIAVENLNNTCDAVNEYMDVDEGFWSKVGKGAAVATAGYLAYKNRDKIKKGLGIAKDKVVDVAKSDAVRGAAGHVKDKAVAYGKDLIKKKIDTSAKNPPSA